MVRANVRQMVDTATLDDLARVNGRLLAIRGGHAADDLPHVATTLVAPLGGTGDADMRRHGILHCPKFGFNVALGPCHAPPS